MGKKSKAEETLPDGGYEYYAFISYKHSRDDGRFMEDTKWATELDKELRYLNIPTEINKTQLIHPDDDSVDPVFRDVTGLPIVKNGELEKVLKRKLRRSKTLVLILSKEMVREENEKFKSGEAWIYWEVKQFLSYHDKDYTRIIPVYIDKDDYSPSKVPTAIEIEKRFQNIEKPYQSYRSDYDWDKQKNLFYQRTAAAVAGSIFGIDSEENKAAFWNFKERARKANEAEKKKNRIQKVFLGFIAAVVAAVSLFIWFNYKSSLSDAYVNKAQAALADGNRGLAIRFAEAAHAGRRSNKKAYEVMWAANDSTKAFLTVKSPVSFSGNDSLFCYIDNHKHVVIMDAISFEEVDRIDAGMAQEVSLSPLGGKVVVWDDGNIYRIFDRNTRVWSEILSQYRNHDVYWGDEDKFIIGSYLLFQGRALYFADGRPEGASSTYEYKRASFVEADSLLITLREEGPEGDAPGVRIYLYEMNLSSDAPNWQYPMNEFVLNKEIVGADILPGTPFIMAYSMDSVYQYSIDCVRHAEKKEEQFILKKRESEKLDNPIVRTETNSGKNLIFAIDSRGEGHCYRITGWVNPRLSRPYIGNIKSRNDYHIPLCAMEEDVGIYYLGNDPYINLYDGRNRGYHLPFVPSEMKIKGSNHGHILCVEAFKEKSGKSDAIYRSYLFAGGDKRMVRSTYYHQEMLSGNYTVSSGMDLFVTEDSLGRVMSRSSSNCLFNPITGTHLMHLDQNEDKEKDYRRILDYNYQDDGLALTYRFAGSGKVLRIYDLKHLQLVQTIPIEDRDSFVQWLDDGSYLYSKEQVLMRGWLDTTITHIPILESYRSYYSGSTANRFVCEKKWFSQKDGIVRQLECSNFNWLSPNGDYYVMRPWRDSALYVVDARQLDTVAVHPVENPIDANGYYKFSDDGRRYIYSDGKETLVCLDIPSGKTLWSRAIWSPKSSIIGTKYIVLQSTSLYVLNLQTGKTVCEFEADEQQLKLALSPDEKWLLAGDKLYSLEDKQLMASRIERDYKKLENEYIVYSRYLMKLPNVSSLFD